MRGRTTQQARQLLRKTGLVCVLGQLFATAASANYLDELEREAARSFDEPAAQTPRASSPTTSSPISSSTLIVSEEKLPIGLEKEGFEQALQQSFYGSYLFYSALNARDQEAVYQEYTENNNVEYLREVIKAKMK